MSFVKPLTDFFLRRPAVAVRQEWPQARRALRSVADSLTTVSSLRLGHWTVLVVFTSATFLLVGAVAFLEVMPVTSSLGMMFILGLLVAFFPDLIHRLGTPQVRSSVEEADDDVTGDVLLVRMFGIVGMVASLGALLAVAVGVDLATLETWNYQILSRLL